METRLSSGLDVHKDAMYILVRRTTKELNMLMKIEKTEPAKTTLSREDLDEIDDCTCIEYCDEDPKTKCGLSGIPHVHPEDPNHPGAYGPCPVHPGRPGDH
ncbi:hypothetical protein [Streptomyces sp. NPDC059783]|uniref:hypothetical protein n=1 Tax=Streptomyces sp. NPDC059783 TaxID=3346944 RepID=UPI003666BE74